MPRRLLHPAPNESWTHNAVAGGEHSAQYAYILGYFNAAEALVSHALSGGTKDTLFYPICFNYRHYVELQLKYLILEAEKLYGAFDKLGWALGTLDQKQGSQLGKTHSLEKLLRLPLDRLGLLTVQVFDDKVRSLIIELHNMDPNGEVFRYPFRQNGDFCIPESGLFDLANLFDRMKDVDAQLSGIDIWMDMTGDTAFSVLSECQDESEYYREYY